MTEGDILSSSRTEFILSGCRIGSSFSEIRVNSVGVPLGVEEVTSGVAAGGISSDGII